jgi:hypothetical protein
MAVACGKPMQGLRKKIEFDNRVLILYQLRVKLHIIFTPPNLPNPYGEVPQMVGFLDASSYKNSIN